jgi:phosphoglycerate-specific signal transduction histidine kinase
MVRGDRDLLELALRPVVINAIEAVCALGDPAANAVTISWGLEQDSCWIVVIDHGPGVDTRLDLLLAGLTTKSGHIGFGLATAKAAMDSLDGRVEVNSNAHGGATVLLEWQGAS